MAACCSLIFTGLFSGCARHTEPIEIALTPKKPVVAIIYAAAPTKVNLTVADERPTREIGKYYPYDDSSKVYIQGDVSKIIKKAIQKRLESGNFQVEENDNANTPNLRVEIRHLNFQIQNQGWHHDGQADSAIKAICTPAQGKVYQNFYKGNHEKQLAYSFAGKDELFQIVNKAVENNLDNIANDKKLKDCLLGH